MDLKSNIVDPYIGQTAEGKKIEFESTDSIVKEELKVFKFNSTKQYIKIYTKLRKAVQKDGVFDPIFLINQ